MALNYISDPQGDKLDDYQSQLSDANWLVISKDWALKVCEKLNLNELNIISFPNLEFRGFHPDQSYILEPNSNNDNPVYQSNL